MTNETRAFLNHLFARVNGHFELTFIHPVRPKGENIRTYSYQLGKSKPDWDAVQKLNGKGWGVYYGSTTNRRAVKPYQRRKEVDAFMIPCLWAEFDIKDGVYTDVEAICKRLYEVTQPPTVILSSGGGVHALWRINPIEITRANFAALKETLRGMAIYLKSDTSVAELARVLRLPGTVNTKPERGGAKCEIIDLLDGELSLAQFAEYRQYAKPIVRPLERPLPRYRPDTLPRKVQAYLDTPAPEGTRNSALNVAAWVMHSEGYGRSEADRVLMTRAQSDGLNEREIQRTITSAYAAPPGVPSYLSKRSVSRMRAGDALKRKIS